VNAMKWGCSDPEATIMVDGKTVEFNRYECCVVDRTRRVCEEG
jgi:hypothetical protein